MKVWTSKFSLAPLGIIEVSVRDIDSAGYLRAYKDNWSYTIDPEHWHRTREEAAKQAEKMRADRIAALNKEIAELNVLAFGPSVQPTSSGGET